MSENGSVKTEHTNGFKETNGIEEINGIKEENGLKKENGHTSTVVEYNPIKNPDEPIEIRIPVPWGHVAAKTYNNRNGSPVMCLHGWQDNSGTFDKLIPLLPKSLFFVSVDLPGHGLSSHLPKGMVYHYVDSVQVMKRIAKYFKWEKFTIMGHSMGAGHGSLYASIYPNSVDRLLMLDLIKPITGDTENYASKIGAAIDHFLFTEEKIKEDESPTYTYSEAVDRYIKATFDTLTEEAAKTLLIRGARRVDEDKYSFNRDIRLRNPSVTRFSHEQLYKILEEIRCPVMIIKAKSAPWFEAKEVCEKALEVYKAKSLFEYVEVDGNHFIHLINPGAIKETVSRFLIDQKATL